MALTQLVMGYRSVSDVALDPDVTVPARALLALDALFPKGHPYMWWSDRF
jgi:predicted acetyltransferase